MSQFLKRPADHSTHKQSISDKDDAEDKEIMLQKPPSRAESANLVKSELRKSPAT
jgi:hypothetical protein